MALNWNQFIMDGTVTTEGGQTLQLKGDASAQDYSVLSVSDLQLKLTRQDLQEIIQLVSREGSSRISIK